MAINYAHRGVNNFNSLLNAIDLIIKSIDVTKLDRLGGTIECDLNISNNLSVSGSTVFLGNNKIVVSGSVFYFQSFDGTDWNTLGTIP